MLTVSKCSDLDETVYRAATSNPPEQTTRDKWHGIQKRLRLGASVYYDQDWTVRV